MNNTNQFLKVENLIGTFASFNFKLPETWDFLQRSINRKPTIIKQQEYTSSLLFCYSASIKEPAKIKFEIEWYQDKEHREGMQLIYFKIRQQKSWEDPEQQPTFYAIWFGPAKDGRTGAMIYNFITNEDVYNHIMTRYCELCQIKEDTQNDTF
jgi:hypothetical protein